MKENHHQNQSDKSACVVLVSVLLWCSTSAGQLVRKSFFHSTTQSLIDVTTLFSLDTDGENNTTLGGTSSVRVSLGEFVSTCELENAVEGELLQSSQVSPSAEVVLVGGWTVEPTRRMLLIFVGLELNIFTNQV